MVRNAALCLAAVCMLGCSSAASSELRVMSFNIRYGTANDGANAWPKRCDVVVNTIKHCEPHVLGTQECLDFQANYITNKLPHYRWLGVGRDKDGGGEYSAVFYDYRHVVPLEYGTFWLSETPGKPGSVSWDSSLPRIVTWARFHHPASGKFFHFYNTHFDHRGRIAREQSALLSAQRITALPEGSAVILTGDFNAVAETSAPWKTLAASGMKDAWTLATERHGPDTTWCDFEAPNPEKQRRIDWILVRGPLSVGRCETVTYNEDGRYPSDHFPVLATLSLD